MYHELSEHILSGEFDIDFAAPALGQSGTYTSELRDPDGKPVGTVHGTYRLAMNRPGDGELMAHIIERIELTDGELHVDAWSTWAGLAAGDTLYCPVTGVSGAHLGRQGFREWRPVDPGKVAFARIGFFQRPTP
ncbi:hypothetical protein CTZ27_09835 [Streptomyces griseocarneus]|nr:hypothetical protein CTZ27_09835 [Streptomyces griseocarneus]